MPRGAYTGAVLEDGDPQLISEALAVTKKRDIAAEIEQGLREALALVRGEKPAARLTVLSACGRFVYRVSWSEEDREFVGTCAEFPSLSHLDVDQDAALRGIQALVAEVVADMRACGEAIPVSSSAQMNE